MSKNSVKPRLTAGYRTARCGRGRHRSSVLVYRFVSGLPLDGRRYSDASFWRRGRRLVGLQPYFACWRWWVLAAGWQRALLRLASTAFALWVLVDVAVVVLLVVIVR